MTAAAQYLPPRPKPVPNATGMFGGRTTCLACGRAPFVATQETKRRSPVRGRTRLLRVLLGGTGDGITNQQSFGPFCRMGPT
jgi:hypothetical protein